MVTATPQTNLEMSEQPYCCQQSVTSQKCSKAWDGRIQGNADSEASVNQGKDRVLVRSGSSVVSSLSLQVRGGHDDGEAHGLQELHGAHEEQAYGDAEEGTTTTTLVLMSPTKIT